MAKNKTQWGGKFRINNVYYGRVKLYHVEVNVKEYQDKDDDWKMLESYDYFRNARRVAKKLDRSFK